MRVAGGHGVASLTGHLRPPQTHRRLVSSHTALGNLSSQSWHSLVVPESCLALPLAGAVTGALPEEAPTEADTDCREASQMT